MNWKLSFLSLLLFLLSTACKESKKKSNAVIHPETALISYLKNDDQTFDWVLEKTSSFDKTVVYRLKLVSQNWRGITWEHSLSVIVPETVATGDALLFISGGNNKNSDLHPGDDDPLTAELVRLAEQNQAVTALIRQVPNQPLFNGRTEDALISYTLHQFKNDGDYSWPLLFPMVKSVVRGMDAVQDFCQQELQRQVNAFLLTGFSKRGWTTWLTGSQDERVKAIAPAVIDVLNMPVNVDYQVRAWGGYSVEIQDYVNLGIAQDISSEGGRALAQMVDPFSYREMLDKPTLILIGTNDPYWPVDAVKNYLYDLSGQTFIYYTPNAGHDLREGVESFVVLSEFFKDMINGFEYPDFTYDLKAEGDGYLFSVSADEPIERVEAWTCTSEDRDFRNDEWTMSASAADVGHGTLKLRMEAPTTGFQANYWNIVFKGEHYAFYPLSTRMYVTGNGTGYLEPEQ